MGYENFQTFELEQQLVQPDILNEDVLLPERSHGLRTLARKGLAIAAIAASSIPAFGATARASTEKVAKAKSQQVDNNGSSLNWADFTSGIPSSLNYLTEDFIVPSVTCPATGDHHVSVWAGLGKGDTDTDPLYQAGVRLECNAGSESTYVWWEVVSPSGDTHEQDFASRQVSAGEKVIVQILPRYGSLYTVRMSVQDYGTNLSQYYPNWTSYHDYDTTPTAASPTQAECVVERPTIGGTYADLLDFGSITFSTATSGSYNKACDVTANNTDHTISSSTSTINHGLLGTAEDMLNSSSTTLASNSGLSSSGEYTITWQAGS
jgi:hypothetical protein